MSQPIETQGRPGRLKQKPFTSKYRYTGAFLGFHFFLILLNLEGNRFGKRKEAKFWIKGLIINSAEKLSFGGTWFQHPLARLNT